MVNRRRTIAAWMVLALGCAGLLGGCGRAINEDFTRLRAWEAYRKGDIAAAKTDFTACVDSDATDLKSQYYLGLIYLKQDNPDAARRHLEQAYALRANDPRARLTLEPGYAETAVPWPQLNEIGDALAEAIYQQGNKPQLFGFLGEMVDRYGEVYDHLRMARYMQKVGDHDGAHLAIEKALKIAKPDDPEPLFAMAEFYINVGDRPQAARYLHEIYLMKPEDKRIHERIRQLGYVPGPTLPVEVNPQSN